LDPVILAFLLPTTLNDTVFKFSRPVIFANLPDSRNSRNKGHAKKTSFTVTLNCHLITTKAGGRPQIGRQCWLSYICHVFQFKYACDFSSYFVGFHVVFIRFCSWASSRKN